MVAGSTITEAEGMCYLTNCFPPVIPYGYTFKTHDWTASFFAGGYISHPVLPHLSVLVEFDYRHQKIHIEPALFSAAMFSEGDLAERDVVAGLVLSFGRHHGK